MRVGTARARSVTVAVLALLVPNVVVAQQDFCDALDFLIAESLEKYPSITGAVLREGFGFGSYESSFQLQAPGFSIAEPETPCRLNLDDEGLGGFYPCYWVDADGPRATFVHGRLEIEVPACLAGRAMARDEIPSAFDDRDRRTEWLLPTGQSVSISLTYLEEGPRAGLTILWDGPPPPERAPRSSR